MTWSPENVDMGIQSLLFQIYLILLSTLLSVNRQQLSVLDAHFTIAVTSSPLTVYLAVASVGDLFGIKTGLYKRIESHRLIIRALAAMILPLWFVLGMIAWMSGTAFRDSSCSGDLGLQSWFWSLVCILINFTLYPGLLANFDGMYSPLVIFLPVLFFLVKSRDQVGVDMRAYWRGASKPWGWLLTPCIFVKCAWYVPIVAIL